MVARIDWKTKLQQVSPFLKGERGGLVCISGADSSGWRSFLKILREIHRKAGPDHTTLLIDPESETTRSHNMILQALEAELCLQPEVPTIQAHIAQTIEAESATTGSINVNINESSGNLHQRIVKVRNALEKICRTVIFVEGCHNFPESTSHWFWSSLWKQHLSKVSQNKILIVCVCEDSNGSCKWALKRPDPAIKINLPPEYAGNDLQEAVNDLIGYLHETGLDSSQLSHKARAFLLGCQNQPTLLHSSLTWYVGQ